MDREVLGHLASFLFNPSSTYPFIWKYQKGSLKRTWSRKEFKRRLVHDVTFSDYIDLLNNNDADEKLNFIRHFVQEPTPLPLLPRWTYFVETITFDECRQMFDALDLDRHGATLSHFWKVIRQRHRPHPPLSPQSPRPERSEWFDTHHPFIESAPPPDTPTPQVRMRFGSFSDPFTSAHQQGRPHQTPSPAAPGTLDQSPAPPFPQYGGAADNVVPTGTGELKSVGEGLVEQDSPSSSTGADQTQAQICSLSKSQRKRQRRRASRLIRQSLGDTRLRTSPEPAHSNDPPNRPPPRSALPVEPVQIHFVQIPHAHDLTASMSNTRPFVIESQAPKPGSERRTLKGLLKQTETNVNLRRKQARARKNAKRHARRKMKKALTDAMVVHPEGHDADPTKDHLASGVRAKSPSSVSVCPAVDSHQVQVRALAVLERPEIAEGADSPLTVETFYTAPEEPVNGPVADNTFNLPRRGSQQSRETAAVGIIRCDERGTTTEGDCDTHYAPPETPLDHLPCDSSDETDNPGLLQESSDVYAYARTQDPSAEQSAPSSVCSIASGHTPATPRRCSSPRVIIHVSPEKVLRDFDVAMDSLSAHGGGEEAASSPARSKSGGEDQGGSSSALEELSRSPTPVIFDPEIKTEAAKNKSAKKKESKKRKRTETTSGHFDSPSPSPKKKRVAAGTSAVIFPPITAEQFGIVQERLWNEPWKLFVAVMLLNKTAGKSAMPVFRQLMHRYYQVERLALAPYDDVFRIVSCLGLQKQRTLKLTRFAEQMMDNPPRAGVRYRCLHYPRKGDGSQWRPNAIIKEDDDDCIGALEIGHLPGLGPYAWDSWRIFCRDVLRGVATGYNGEGAVAGFEPEWKRVVPQDKELRAFLRWMWLREGWVWDPVTGGKTRADEETMEQARKGETDWEVPDNAVAAAGPSNKSSAESPENRDTGGDVATVTTQPKKEQHSSQITDSAQSLADPAYRNHSQESTGRHELAGQSALPVIGDEKLTHYDAPSPTFSSLAKPVYHCHSQDSIGHEVAGESARPLMTDELLPQVTWDELATDFIHELPSTASRAIREREATPGPIGIELPSAELPSSPFLPPDDDGHDLAPVYGMSSPIDPGCSYGRDSHPPVASQCDLLAGYFDDRPMFRPEDFDLPPVGEPDPNFVMPEGLNVRPTYLPGRVKVPALSEHVNDSSPPRSTNRTPLATIYDATRPVSPVPWPRREVPEQQYTVDFEELL